MHYDKDIFSHTCRGTLSLIVLRVTCTGMAQPTADDLQTPEYLTTRDLSDKLRIGIQNDLEGIVTKVYSAGIISANARNEIIDPATHEASSRRTRKFITMLVDKIQIDPGCLAHFRGLLAEEPAHRSLVDMIGELASYPCT